MHNNLLQIENLVVDYGLVKALKGINLVINKGTIVALLGSNGAGKTTTIKAISGVVKVAAGNILFNGEYITNLEPYQISKKGIFQSPEGRQILGGLTVEENLNIGAYSLKPQKRVMTDGSYQIISTNQLKEELLNQVFEYFPILKERRQQQALTLSGGEQQMLSIGRALMGNPELLLLDEPSLGLAPLIVKDIFEIILKMKNDGKTILIVEQNALQTLKIADYGYVLELGKINMEGTGKELLSNQKLIDAYLG